MGDMTEERLRAAAARAPDRTSLLIELFDALDVRTMCEVGVFRGELAGALLRGCPGIGTYYMVDPWVHLENWNKPANAANEVFSEIHDEAMRRTEFAGDRRRVLRGTLAQKAAEIGDAELDAAYVDGDHTLRGITIDLHRILPKVRQGGIICGDDFVKNVWQHGTRFSPTEVFPYAIYFAEAHDLPVVTLPFNQFAILNSPEQGYRLIDLGGYAGLDPREIYLPARRGLVRGAASLIRRATRRIRKGA